MRFALPTRESYRASLDSVVVSVVTIAARNGMNISNCIAGNIGM